MPFVRMMRMLSAMESGQLDGAGLEALLQEPGRLGELQVMLSDRALWKRARSSSETMASIFGSRAATAAALEIASVRVEIVESADLLGSLAAAAPAKMALSDSHAALVEIAANPAAVNILRSASGYAVTPFTSVASGDASLPLSGERYILLGMSTAASASGWSATPYTRVAGSTVAVPLVYNNTAALSQGYTASLKAPYKVSMAAAIAGLQMYAGLLRCDI